MKAILNKTLFYFLLLFLLLVACFSYGMADYHQYEKFFSRAKTGFVQGYQMELGYVFLEKAFCWLNFEFDEFRAIYLSVAILIFAHSIYHINRKHALFVLMIYCVFPFFYDVCQIRHLMATSIVLYAVRYLNNYSKKNICKYCALLILASTQHLIALFWFFFIFASFDIPYKRFIKYNFLLLIATSLLCYAICINYFQLSSVYNSLCWFFIGSIRESGAIFMKMQFRLSYLLLAIVLFIIQVFCLCRFNKLRKLNINNEYLARISILSLLFLVLVCLNEHFFRAFRSLLVVFYISCFCCSESYSFTSGNRIIFKAIPMILALFFFVMFLSSKNVGNHWDSIVIPIIKNNYIIECFF